METTIHNGKKCVLIPLDTFVKLQGKILAQRQLIEDFQEEMNNL